MRWHSVVMSGLALSALASAAHGQKFATAVNLVGNMMPTVPCIDPSDPNCDGTGVGMGDSPGLLPSDSRLMSFQINIAAVVTSGGLNGSLGGYLHGAVLNAAQTYGAGFTGGFSNWPDVGQAGIPGAQGDFTGLNFPFRDYLNSPEFSPYIPGGYDAENDNGVRSTDGSQIMSIFGRQNSQYGLRGNPGFGLTDAINLYSFEFTATDFTPRTITISLTGGSAVYESVSTGQMYTVPIESSSEDMMIIPAAPTGAGLAVGIGILGRRRRN